MGQRNEFKDIANEFVSRKYNSSYQHWSEKPAEIIDETRLFLKLIVDVHNGNIRIIKERSLWVKVQNENSWCRFISSQIHLKENEHYLNHNGVVSKEDYIDFNGTGYLEIHDAGIDNDFRELLKEVIDLQIAKEYILKKWEENLSVGDSPTSESVEETRELVASMSISESTLPKAKDQNEHSQKDIFEEKLIEKIREGLELSLLSSQSNQQSSEMEGAYVLYSAMGSTNSNNILKEGRNIYIEAEIDTIERGGPIFFFPQEPTDKTKAIILEEIPSNNTETKKISWQILENTGRVIKHVTKRFYASGFHSVTINQGKKCENFRFDHLVDAIPLLLDSPNGQSADTSGAFPFDEGKTTFYIGHNPITNINFNGKLRRLVFDPNASCLGCTS